MTIKSAIIGATTAIAIATVSVGATTAASAAPFTSMTTARIDTGAGIEQVKSKKKKHHGGHHGHHNNHYRGINPGAAAAIGIGALALGAIVAGSAQAAPRRCEIVEVERWSNRYRAYVVTTERRCY